jgi:hypothetical protein
MNRRSADDPRPLFALVLVAVCLVVASHVGPWLRRLDASHLLTLALAGAVVLLALGVLVLAVRWVACRRTLAGRVTVVLIPTDGFAPAVETVLRFAAGLGRARRLLRGSLDAPASAVRVCLDTDADGRLRYTVTLPGHAARALRTAVGAFGDDVEIGELEEPPADGSEVQVARAELVLARPSTEPLRAIGVDPDPLTGFAHALGALDPRDGNRAAVAIDLLPVTAAQARRMRRRMIRQAYESDTPRLGLGQVLGGGPQRRGGRAGSAELVERTSTRRALTSKLGQPEPLFAIQVLLRVASPVPGVAPEHVRGLLAAFDPFAGENHFRVSGLRIPGVLFLGSDVPWRRRRFDRRWRTGRFAPARRGIVTATEIAGLLKPPTATCHATNVLRSGGSIPPAPAGLPTFKGQRALLPLGRVTRSGRERIVGVPLSSTFFSYMAGRSRYGKTETAIGQFIHLARSGHGCFFLDPHEDAITKIKAYLTDPDLRDRVVEIDLASQTGLQPGWNLFGVQGRSLDRAQMQVDAVVDAFASALLWDERNTRALNLVTQAAQALTELAHRLPAELAPTLFQIPTLLGNDDWRTAVLPYVSPPTRQFFTDRFPRLPAGAITPVTNLIDRLRVAPAVAGLLGSATCTYDVRKAMDNGQIVLACPGSGSARDRLVANFLVYDLLHAAKTRASLAPEKRRPFYVFLDEVQTYDGASSGNLAALLEQTAKYGVRAFLFNQNPERLTPATLNAVTTNRSHLHTTALNSKAAALLTREWGGAVDPEVITRLRRYTYLASVTLDTEISAPFLVHGVPADELFADDHHPDQLVALDEAIDRNTERRPITETLDALADHDRNIINYLRQHRETGQVGRPGPAVAGGHGERTIGPSR